MQRADIIYLIGETPAAHGVFATHTQVKRKVYCQIRSVGRSEMYQAMSAGHVPEYIFALSHNFEYKNEKLAEYNGELFNIIRTYATPTNGIDLTVERSNHVPPEVQEPTTTDGTTEGTTEGGGAGV